MAVPTSLGSVKTAELARMSGALSEMELVVPRSFRIMALAFVLSPRTVKVPLSTCAPEVIVPVVLITVESVISEAPLIVPAEITELVKVLFERVSVAARVTTTPSLGNVAVELTPVPPLLVDRRPDTAELDARFTLPKVGPLVVATKTWSVLPGPVVEIALLPLPTKIPLRVKVLAPVPPLATLSVPEVIVAAESAGISDADNWVAAVTRPLALTVTFV